MWPADSCRKAPRPVRRAPTYAVQMARSAAAAIERRKTQNG